jgi:hypothetical protein
MEYKGIQFEIVQATNPSCWRWIVVLDATRMRTGIALTRADVSRAARRRGRMLIKVFMRYKMAKALGLTISLSPRRWRDRIANAVCCAA